MTLPKIEGKRVASAVREPVSPHAAPHAPVDAHSVAPPVLHPDQHARDHPAAQALTVPSARQSHVPLIAQPLALAEREIFLPRDLGSVWQPERVREGDSSLKLTDCLKSAVSLGKLFATSLIGKSDRYFGETFARFQRERAERLEHLSNYRLAIMGQLQKASPAEMLELQVRLTESERTILTYKDLRERLMAQQAIEVLDKYSQIQKSLMAKLKTNISNKERSFYDRMITDIEAKRENLVWTARSHLDAMEINKEHRDDAENRAFEARDALEKAPSQNKSYLEQAGSMLDKILGIAVGVPLYALIRAGEYVLPTPVEDTTALRQLAERDLTLAREGKLDALPDFAQRAATFIGAYLPDVLKAYLHPEVEPSLTMLQSEMLVRQKHLEDKVAQLKTRLSAEVGTLGYVDHFKLAIGIEPEESSTRKELTEAILSRDRAELVRNASLILQGSSPKIMLNLGKIDELISSLGGKRDGQRLEERLRLIAEQEGKLDEDIRSANEAYKLLKPIMRSAEANYRAFKESPAFESGIAAELLNAVSQVNEKMNRAAEVANSLTNQRAVLAPTRAQIEGDLAALAAASGFSEVKGMTLLFERKKLQIIVESTIQDLWTTNQLRRKGEENAAYISRIETLEKIYEAAMLQIRALEVSPDYVPPSLLDKFKDEFLKVGLDSRVTKSLTSLHMQKLLNQSGLSGVDAVGVLINKIGTLGNYEGFMTALNSLLSRQPLEAVYGNPELTKKFAGNLVLLVNQFAGGNLIAQASSRMVAIERANDVLGGGSLLGEGVPLHDQGISDELIGLFRLMEAAPEYLALLKGGWRGSSGGVWGAATGATTELAKTKIASWTADIAPEDFAKILRAASKGTGSLAQDTAVKATGSFFRDVYQEGLRSALWDRFSPDAWSKWYRVADRNEKLARTLGVYLPATVGALSTAAAISFIISTGGLGAVPVALLGAAGFAFTLSGAAKGVADRVFHETVANVRRMQRREKIHRELEMKNARLQDAIWKEAHSQRKAIFPGLAHALE